MLSIYLLYSVSVFKFNKIYMRKHYIYQMYFKRMAILLGWLSRIFGGFSGEIVKYLFNIFSFFEINTTLIHS